MTKLNAAEILNWIEGTATPGDSQDQIRGRFQKMFCEGESKAARAQLQSELRLALTMWELKRRQTRPNG
ncbi:hypothetical protein [Rhodobacter maris]|uniref:Uncharacterized protein n=1 Tax=Rhodobacter maris TaxID=446682 RepID=A0A285S571_9RHOB|nr:hypothetical protein [Rhodobacter maris]SOC02164.1 hypothetical protein SAMN05877831_10393 [Rhodobacter maris]